MHTKHQPALPLPCMYASNAWLCRQAGCCWLMAGQHTHDICCQHPFASTGQSSTAAHRHPSRPATPQMGFFKTQLWLDRPTGQLHCSSGQTSQPTCIRQDCQAAVRVCPTCRSLRAWVRGWGRGRTVLPSSLVRSLCRLASPSQGIWTTYCLHWATAAAGIPSPSSATLQCV